jgi:polyphosphate glucokinase
MPGARVKRSRGKRSAILVIDVGGTRVKMQLSSQHHPCRFESGPKLTAKDMVATVKELTDGWTYDVVSIGYPGPVAGNRPIAEPYNLGSGWAGFDFAKAFHRPVKVVNDAVMQALGSYSGGRMLFLGLGTGLGSAMIIDGVIEPMEIAHLRYKKGKSFEDYLGTRGLEHLGLKKWRKHVADVVNILSAALEPDYVVLGGGNVNKMEKLPARTRRGNNDKAFEGGIRLWKEHRTRPGRMALPNG